MTKRILAFIQASLIGLVLASQVLGPVWAATFEQVNTTSSQTLTSKTYSNPIFSGTSSGTYTLAGTIGITSPTITNPSVTGTVSGSATYSTPTITGGTQNSPTINTPTLNLQTYNEGSLPSAATAGRIVWLADGPRGLIGDFGTKLAHLFGYNWIAEFYSTCNDAITAIGSTQATMVIGKTCTVSSSTTVPTTLTLLLTGTGDISVASGQTLTLAGVIQAPPARRLFTGDGSVICASTCWMTEVRPEWFGGGPGVASATNWVAMDKSVVFLPAGANKGGTILFQGGTYQFNDTVTTQSRYLRFQGQGQSITRLQLTATGSLKHAIKTTGTTGYLGVFDMEISPSTPLTTDQGMKAIDMDRASATLPAKSVLEVARIRSTGFNFGTYCDGDSTLLIERCQLTDSAISTQGLNATSVSEPYVAQQVVHAIVERNVFNNNDLGDHCIYAIHAINLQANQNECYGATDFALKLISQPLVNGVTATLGVWTAEGNRLHDNAGDLLVTIAQNHVLPKVSLRNNQTSTTSFNASAATVLVQALSTSSIYLADLSGLAIDTTEKGAIVFGADAGATIKSVVAKDLFIRNWGTSAAGTYNAMNYSGAGTYSSAVISGYFDGNSNGRAVSVLQLAGGFTHVQYLDMVETGTTVPGYYQLLAPIGKTKAFAKPVIRLYTQTGATTGTTAVTTEETLGTYTLAANGLSSNGDCVNVTASGSFGANANTKTVRLYFGTVVMSTNGVTTAPNNTTWSIMGRMCLIASAQESGFANMMVGATPQTTTVTSPTEATTASIVIKVTGQNGTASANDIKLYSMDIDLVNAP